MNKRTDIPDDLLPDSAQSCAILNAIELLSAAGIDASVDFVPITPNDDGPTTTRPVLVLNTPPDTKAERLALVGHVLGMLQHQQYSLSAVIAVQRAKGCT